MLDHLFDGFIFPAIMPLVSFLLTYLFHSTIMLGSAWLLARLPFLRSFSLKDMLLKTALVGSLVTTLVHSSLNPNSLFGRWDLPLASNYVSHKPDVGGKALEGVREPAGHFDDEVLLQREHDQLEKAEIEVLKRPGGRPVAPTGIPSEHGWPSFLVGGWLLGVAVMSIRFIRTKTALRNALQSRRDLITGDLSGRLHNLETRHQLVRPIRLTKSREIASPMVVGTSEICLPHKALTGLSSQQQESLLAHEVAHIVRQDQLWLWTCQLLQIIFFFQPLLRVTRRGLQETAEFLCDDWAVRNTGEPLNLAKCLAEVASWMKHQPQGLPVVGMAEIRSPLIRRVHRLVNPPKRDTKDMPRPVRFALGLLFLATALTVAPNFETTEGEAGALANSEQRTRRSTSAEVLTTDKPNVYAIRVNWQEDYDGRAIKAKAQGEFSFWDDDTRITYLSRGSYLELEERLDGLRRKIEVKAEKENEPKLTYWENNNRQELTDSTRAWLGEMLVEFIREVNIYDAGRAWRILESDGIEALKGEIAKIRNDSVRSIYARVLRQAGQAHRENRQP
jgi:hypothetical protein